MVVEAVARELVSAHGPFPIASSATAVSPRISPNPTEEAQFDRNQGVSGRAGEAGPLLHYEGRQMVYASILVHLDLSADSLRRVRLTRELAGLWSARVVGLCAAEPSGGSLLGNATSTLRVQHAARLKDACDTQQDHFSMIADGVPLEWRSGTGSPLA